MTADPKPPPEFDLAFTDVETSGTDEREHEILELAIVRLDPRTMVEKDRFHRYFLPTKPVPEEAAKINGYSEVKWRLLGAKAMTAGDLIEIAAVLRDAAFAGQVVGFDKRFLYAAYERARLPAPIMDYHMIDIAVFGWPLVIAKKTRGLSLKYTRKFFGLPGEQAHTALADVLDEIEVYKHFMQAYGEVWRGIDAVAAERERIATYIENVDWYCPEGYIGNETPTKWAAEIRARGGKPGA